MIVGFSKHGTGGGYGPVAYLTFERNPDGSARTPTPTVLRGNPEQVRQLIDDLPFKHKYTSGVLSFEEKPWEVMPEVQASIMDEFEEAAFAGLSKEQRPPVLWVRHEHAGRLELNFLIPRVEPLSGKSLNIAPPKSSTREMFDTFRTVMNARHGFSDPDDPARARNVSLPHHIEKLLAEASRKGEAPKLRGATALRKTLSEAITAHVAREVGQGSLKSQKDVLGHLEGQGYTLARTGKDYITIIEPQTGERIRLKGALYSREGFDPAAATRQGIAYGVPDDARADAFAAKLERLTAGRARYHRQRYGVPDWDREPAYAIDQTPELPPHEGEALEDYLERTLGDEAILPARQDDDEPPPSTQRRQRWQGMERAAQAIEGDERDRDRNPFARRSGAFGMELRAAGQGYPAQLAGLDRAGERLGRASRTLAASTPAFEYWLEEWLRRFYRWERERDWGIER